MLQIVYDQNVYAERAGISQVMLVYGHRHWTGPETTFIFNMTLPTKENKHNQAVSFKNTYMCYKTIFQKNGRNWHI